MRRLQRPLLCFALALTWQVWTSSSANAAPEPPALGTLTQGHHFAAKELATSDAVLLYGFFPLMIGGNAVLLTGNVVALIRGKQRKGWGGVGLVVGILTAIGGSFLVAEEGIGWLMIPITSSAALLGLSITNLALGDRPAPSKPAAPPKSNATTMGLWR